MKSYAICRSKIIYEVLNTEVILIDFNTGDYYTLTHVAKDVWLLIEQQVPMEQMAQILSQHYKCEIDLISQDLQQFINELLGNGLIELIEESKTVELSPINFQELSYIRPEVQKYGDVQHLLLLDPIHEVTEAGWPEKLN